MTAPTPQQLVEHALDTSRSESCIAIASVSSGANLRWANNTLTTNGVSQRGSVPVISFASTSKGVAAGSVTGTAATLDQVTALVESADRAAAGSEPAKDAAELVSDVAALDWHEPPEETSISVYAEFAPALGEAFGHATSSGRVLYGFVDHDMTTTYLGSTTGLRRRHVQPTGHWGCTAKPADLSSSAWVGGATRDFKDVDPAAFDAELERRLGWARRTVDLPPGRYDTVLPPTAVSDLMIYAYWTASARMANDGQTVFSKPGGGTRIDERLSRHPVQVYSDPSYPGLGADPFVVAPSSGDMSSVFDNGLPLRRTDWVRDGTLRALIQTRETAELTGEEVTPGIDNLVVEVGGGAGSAEDLAAHVDRGLLLTCLWYIREVDPQTLLLTGLTRDGVYLVEGGEVTAVVNNFRFNESPIDLMRRFTQASETGPSFSREWGDYFPRTPHPPPPPPAFTMPPASQAN